MKRLVWVDYAKAIGIFLVILAHTQIWSPVTDWISVFRMPLFFFLSGFLFSFSRNADRATFVKKRFCQIVVPYVWLNLITFVFWLLVSRQYGVSDAEQAVLWYQPLVAALLCNGSDMVHNIPLWFLLCLFLMEVIYYVVFRPLNRWQRWLAAAVFGLLGYLNYQFVPFVLPFSLGTAFVGMMFYFLGNELSEHGMKDWCVPTLWQGLLLLLSTAVVTYFAVTNERVYLYCNHYGNYAAFLLAALCGIYMVYALTDMMARWLGRNKAVEYVSRNTLAICGLHLMSYTLLKGVAVYGFGVSLQQFVGTVWPNVLLAVAGMGVCCLLAYLIRKFCPMVIGASHSAA